MKEDDADFLKEIVKRALLASRWDGQGGYPGYRGEGEWSHRISPTLYFSSSEELNRAFSVAGVVPDEIVSLGTCRTCRFSVNGRERGWEAPCVSCARPKMSNWEAK